jgi:predicted Fe-Mo cluster-binding NifX family protein
MKIAVVSDDGVTISQHFGRAAHYVVATVENDKIIALETREKTSHGQLSSEPHATEHDPRGHGFDPAAQSRHTRMLAPISDCSVLLARGMGAGAYNSIRAANIRAIITDVPMITDAVRAYLAGTLVDHTERLH